MMRRRDLEGSPDESPDHKELTIMFFNPTWNPLKNRRIRREVKKNLRRATSTKEESEE